MPARNVLIVQIRWKTTNWKYCSTKTWLKY